MEVAEADLLRGMTTKEATARTTATAKATAKAEADSLRE
jgi:hypothetical protein